jgi:hypothetical protein
VVARRQRGVIRRRRGQGLERVLGTPALFATAYGNVGSSIYYALGVTAVFALGLSRIDFENHIMLFHHCQAKIHDS